ncbi:MAG: peptidoglycan binding domain-containing protein [Chloroflexi bacterium OLB15]|nr:MAG: peptidoglycan binding domain-containing protein [Chloroflexi bacterium OLB15]
MTGYHQRDARSVEKHTRTPEAHTHNPTANLDTSSVVDLQRIIGNQAVQRLINNAGIQTKMTVGAANDPYEMEADAVAKQVMTGGESSVQRESESMEDEISEKRMPQFLQRAKLGEDDDEMQMKRADVQREVQEDELNLMRADIQRDDELEGIEDEIQEKRVQRQADDLSGSFDVEGQVEQQIQSSKGSGQAMGSSSDFFTQRMGHDFSNVNIHTDSSADNLNRSLGAKAFTTGNDIYFRSGEYNPSSSSGQELLAHELTHVVQQTGGAPVQTKREDKD